MGNTKWKRCMALLLTLSMIFSFSASDIGLAAGPGKAAETERYIYFDNGLSGYDKVYYAVSEDDGMNYSNYKEMVLLNTLDPKDENYPSSMEHVNPEYVYVTPEKIADGTKIKFKGVASGTVYDTMSNYQMTSESREWGYDYKDFVWETTKEDEEKLTVSPSWNCYFAPALAMQYKYSGVDPINGDTVDFIKLAGWAEKSEESITGSNILPVELTTEQLNYKANGFSNLYSFTEGGVIFTILGNSGLNIKYNSEEKNLNGNIFNMELAGNGNLLNISNAGGTLTIYANTSLSVTE